MPPPEPELLKYRLHNPTHMPRISVRLDEETKSSTEALRDVDWSDVIRQSLRDHLAARKRRNRVEALHFMERVSAHAPVPKGHDSTRIIRHWRDRRYGRH